MVTRTAETSVSSANVAGAAWLIVPQRSYEKKLPREWRKQTMRILLIEDDPVVATSIELMLRTENLAVFPWRPGRRVQLGRLNEHDLILLDLNLPDMSATMCSAR